MMTRIEGLTNRGMKVHMFSPNLHRAGQLNSENILEINKSASTSSTIIYARCTAEDKFFTVKQGSNDLEILDLTEKRRIASFKGYPEEPYSKYKIFVKLKN